MPLVTCKEVIEDLIKNGSKNGSKRKNLVSHMIGALPSSESWHEGHEIYPQLLSVGLS